MNAIDYASDAQSFDAWAGTGPNVTRIVESGDQGAETELRSRYNLTIAQWVANDVEPADAMAGIDVEGLAREVVITWREACRVCGITVEWTTAAWEPRETEAPLDGSGDIVCDAHA